MRIIVYVCLLAVVVWFVPSACSSPAAQNEQPVTDAAPVETGGSDTSPPVDSTEPNEPAPKPPENPLEGIAAPTLLAKGFGFTEGPIWDPVQKRLLFSDILTNQIHEIELSSETAKTFRKPSNFSNGLAFDTEGRLLAAERSTRRISRTEKDGTVTTLADSFEGKKFHETNDIAVHRDGSVYFTDPPYVVPESAREIPFNGVFRISPKGDSVTALWKGDSETRPNGIVLSPDDARLYFAESNAAVIWVATLRADGTIDTPKEFAKTAGTPDGMAIDERENLYVATKDGVQVFRKDGHLWGTIAVPLQPANCTFGGPDYKTLVIAARGSLFLIPNMHYAGRH